MYNAWQLANETAEGKKMFDKTTVFGKQVSIVLATIALMVVESFGAFSSETAQIFVPILWSITISFILMSFPRRDKDNVQKAWSASWKITLWAIATYILIAVIHSRMRGSQSDFESLMREWRTPAIVPAYVLLISFWCTLITGAAHGYNRIRYTTPPKG